ncbi:hypothetical protein ASG31_18110, partial [Chryseobacterium sp. Leaf404]|uniref:IgGFc-binding protein n=2 Tax=unclassified Chryseobacterium TaxID=2593645 RepID=UPI000701E925
MKKFLLTVFTFICVTINAQLDTEHWFAPMAARTGLSAPQSFFYLSTNETTPFQIDIYSGNVFYMSTTVSKNNPVQFIVPADYMMIANQNFIMNVSNKGFYLKGEKKFYATFRFSITNHAEIITSKGLAGLGTKFYAAMAPLTAQNDFTNSTIGVTATENNTTVTVSGYNPAVVFADGTSSPTKTFTLNKGQSYILETVSLDGIANLTGLVGAKIESDKPISVTNGNYNGFYINQPYNGADILMDQSVPVERLGKDFVVVKGNGPISSQMEKVLIVATEDNTTYSVNGVASGVTLNAGQYKLIESGSYINQGGNHYNIGISSTKNIYVYQLLAGVSSGTITATGGFNYIPPVNCFLPNKVDEIGMINKIGNTVYDTKLNIITQSGATVTLNGNAIASSDGPYPVSGNPNWVSYSVPNVSGNITVNSTKSVTAGIIGGSGAVGYGGFFSGFSTVPSIVKTGDCFTGITLQVDSSFDSYQWYLNGVAIPGATTYFINPELYGAGNYTCSITKNNCDTKVTPVYNYVSCPPIVTTTFDIGNCNTKIITPALTNSTQQINQSQTLITSQPSLGTVSVNNVTGQISYTPVPGLINDVTDSFSYYIEGNGSPAAFQYFQVNFNIDVLQVNNATVTTCNTIGTTGIFDLTSASVTTDPGATVTYYSNPGLTVPISVPTSYSSPAGVAYAKIISMYGCFNSALLTLTVNPTPNINTANFNANLCDDNLDGTINVDFSTITPQIVTNPGSFSVKYYLDQADANIGNNNILPIIWSYSTNTTVYVRVESIAGCPPLFGQINFTIGNKIALSTQDFSTFVCDTNWDVTENVDLNNYKNNFSTDPAVSVTFYSTLANAQNATGAIAANQTISPTQVFYLRFQSTAGCANVAKLTLTLDQLTANNASINACAGATGQALFDLTAPVLTTAPGATVTYFSDAALSIPISVPTAYPSAGGTVYAKVTSQYGCSKVTLITLSVNPSPNINTANFNANLCDDNLDGIINI